MTSIVRLSAWVALIAIVLLTLVLLALCPAFRACSSILRFCIVDRDFALRCPRRKFRMPDLGEASPLG